MYLCVRIYILRCCMYLRTYVRGVCLHVHNIFVYICNTYNQEFIIYIKRRVSYYTIGCTNA